MQCVHCQAVLKSPAPVPAGKTVKCPSCKQSFTTSETPVPPPESIPNMEIPEESGGLVEPDEEIPETDVEEEADEAPPAKKKKRKDDDEDDAPRSKKKRRDVDDEDDEPPPKKKNRKDDEDAGAGGKKKKKTKKAGSSMLMLLILGGGVLVLSLCCLCGGGGGTYFYFSKPLAGRWEPVDARRDPGMKFYIEFGYFGSGKVYFEERENIANKKLWGAAYFTYSTTGRNPILLETKITHVDSNEDRVNLAREEQKRDIGRIHRHNVTFNGDIMTMETHGGGVQKFRRAR